MYIFILSETFQKLLCLLIFQEYKAVMLVLFTYIVKVIASDAWWFFCIFHKEVNIVSIFYIVNHVLYNMRTSSDSECERRLPCHIPDFLKKIFLKIYYELYLSFHQSSPQQSVVFNIDSVWQYHKVHFSCSWSHWQRLWKQRELREDFSEIWRKTTE